MREIIGDLLIIALGIILIVHFILFWFYGWIFVGETNKIILGVETAMAVGVLALGIERLRDDLK